MSIRSKLLALASATLLGSAAQAADVRLGLHVESAGIAFAEFGSQEAMIIPGVNISVARPIARNLAVRGQLSADYYNYPFLRLDGTLISLGNVYGGVGLGVGMILSNRAAESTSFLYNFHALVGKNFGPAQVELYARAGMISSLGVSVNYLIPTLKP